MSQKEHLCDLGSTAARFAYLVVAVGVRPTQLGRQTLAHRVEWAPTSTQPRAKRGRAARGEPAYAARVLSRGFSPSDLGGPV